MLNLVQLPTSKAFSPFKCLNHVNYFTNTNIAPEKLTIKMHINCDSVGKEHTRIGNLSREIKVESMKSNLPWVG